MDAIVNTIATIDKLIWLMAAATVLVGILFLGSLAALAIGFIKGPK